MSYPRLTEVFDWYIENDYITADQFQWEAIDTTTDDGHILTSFSVWSTKNYDDSKAPVLFMHGDFSDGIEWFDGYDDNGRLPLHLLLAEEGHEIWIGNNRGTQHSQGHVSLSTSDAEFWAWSWAEMGSQDCAALINDMYTRTGEKVYYIGHSQGTSQMFYALADNEDYFASRMAGFLAFAPCTVDAGYCDPESEWTDTMLQFPGLGVHSLYGDVSADALTIICDNFDSDVCDEYNDDSMQTVSVQAQLHWWQNNCVDRFQEYAPNWSDGDRITDLIALENISKVPISMFVGSKDDTCPPSTAAAARDLINSEVDYILFEGADHGVGASYNSQSFLDCILKKLDDNSNCSQFMVWNKSNKV